MAESQVVEKDFYLKNANIAPALFGINDSYLKLLEESKNVTINPFGDYIKISGNQEDVIETQEILSELVKLLNQGINLSEADIVSAVKMAEKGTLEYFQDLYSNTLLKDRSGRPIRVKNYSQRQYVQMIKNNDLTFGIGPAGTGKTYLAVVMAVAALKRREVDRLILTRPAVEAGESLGFLPGDLKEKVDPYLRPIYDALNSILGAEHVERLIERGVIEIAPLAYMRGRTLDKAFVILDEAQNTTRAQMKMFLTRLGFGSKMIVNGDASQIDLPKGHSQSGLVDAENRLKGLPHIAFVNFDANDVVRHPVVSEIIRAYENNN
ncbi:PhoH family protein [Lactobacillus salivarius]|uniref:PhoH-like protein n=3 Tax=Ligilactobacillus salivarius TaxID=1624 RepID=V6DLR8_9LACO|nr:PhoH family protein [Ligilactobacillus salivarius]CDK35671.1 Phosphate starvation-inducible protein PhoH, predicted ATPase [Ligilactobacillus salivarius cp400]AIR10599.1 PhoH protein [Ligilactobacillus salivarius]ATP38014.1 PhoH family protein [Ligilactobacillus salivarius]EEJ74731.1 PhoH family protein [Ligilactobacillus salivarius DSM 20555 = ATCC 11741]KRM70802.1 phosphate starvation-inducible protein PhoH [Ligilactobacillus salivarius DSM 20555 = ATCC 11741]